MNSLNKVIYITGANGFIGQKLVEHLAAKNYQAYALLRKNSIPSFQLNKNTHVVYGDLTDSKSLKKTLPTGAIVVNLAANPYDKKLSYQVNVGGTQKLIEASLANKVSKFIQISSQATKIKRQGVYAKTKNASDVLVRQSSLKYVILKPSLVYGGGEKGLFNKIRSMAKALPFIPVFGDGNTKLYPIEVEDFAKIIEKIIQDEKLTSGEFDVGSTTVTTYNSLYRAITGGDRPAQLVHVPVWIGLGLARLFSVLKKPPFYEDNVLGSTQDTGCNPYPILKKYRFAPLSFKAGVQKILNPAKIRLAVVGLGKMGTLHMSILKTFPEVEIVALVDTNQALYKTVKSMGIEGTFYSSLEDACKQTKINAVYITTPTFTHLGLLKTAIKHNLHIFIEKPVTLTPVQLTELKKIKTNTVVHTGYTLLNNRVFEEVARLIKSKTYGEVINFSGRFEHGEVLGPKMGWMFNKKLSGGGVLMNPGPHFFSVLNLFFGKPKKIAGMIKNIYSLDLDDEVKAELSYPGFKGTIFLSWSVPGRNVAKSEFTIRFKKATLITDGKEITVKIGQKNSKINFADLKPKIQSIFNINPNANGEAYYLESRNFIAAILGQKIQVENDLKAALQTEAMIFDCYKNCKLVEKTK